MAGTFVPLFHQPDKFMHIRAIAVLLVFQTFLACKNEPKADATKGAANQNVAKTPPKASGNATVYRITEGVVNWAANYTIDKKGHNGAIKVESGELMVDQGQLFFGKATMDMNSISVLDIKDPRGRLDLESHLKDADFFETNKFPKATFEFVEVVPNNTPEFNFLLNGNLIMKGISAPVSIPVNLSIKEDILLAESIRFSINRTQWGVNFNSGIIGTAMDKMIDDMVPIQLKITAKKG